ncbi:MAG: DUF937 domain-containing protein [Bosea sp. (in: a-proteobacteria)]
MMNLFEIMQQAQGGNAMQNLSRQFGLSPDQAQSAVEAVLPAFQMGLERQTQNADLFGNFMQQLASGQHAQFVDLDGDGIPDEAAPMGKDVLSQLFGGKAVSSAVTQQAAAMSGISGSIMKAMLPVIASMIMGGLFKGMNNQGFGGILGQIAGQMMGGNNPMGGGMGNNPMGNNPMSNNPMGELLEGMLGGGRQQQSPANPMGELLEGMLGGGRQQQQQQQAPANPMGDILGQILGQAMGGQQPQQQQANPQSDMMKAGLDALTGMFNAGTQAQKTQMDGMQSIFEQMMGGKR